MLFIHTTKTLFVTKDVYLENYDTVHVLQEHTFRVNMHDLRKSRENEFHCEIHETLIETGKQSNI